MLGQDFNTQSDSLQLCSSLPILLVLSLIPVRSERLWSSQVFSAHAHSLAHVPGLLDSLKHAKFFWCCLWTSHSPIFPLKKAAIMLTNCHLWTFMRHFYIFLWCSFTPVIFTSKYPQTPNHLSCSSSNINSYVRSSSVYLSVSQINPSHIFSYNSLYVHLL